MLRTLNGIILGYIGNAKSRTVNSIAALHAIRHPVITPALVVNASNYSAMDELLKSPQSFVTDFNGVAYVDSKLLSRVYGVEIDDLHAVVSKMNLPADFKENNLIKNHDGSYNFTLLGLLTISKCIEGDLSTEVTLAFIRALMFEKEGNNTNIITSSTYRREARDYAANMFQNWIRQAEKAGIAVDEFKQADIDKFADGLLSESLTRIKVQIDFNQHLDTQVSFIPS